jgi:hypothetical protein
MGCLWNFYSLITGKEKWKKEPRNNRDVPQKSKVIDDPHDFNLFGETMQ